MHSATLLGRSSTQVQANSGSSGVNTSRSRIVMVSGNGGPIYGGQRGGGSSCTTLGGKGGERSWCSGCAGPAPWGGRQGDLTLGRGSHTSPIQQ